MTSIVTSWQATQGTHYADYVSAVISAGLKRWQGDLASDLAQAAAEAHAEAVLSAAESSADARAARQIAGAGLAWATIVGPAWNAAAAAQAAAAAAAIGALADASQVWQSAIGSAFVGWAMAQAQAGADFGIAAAIAGATAGKAAAAAGSIYSAAVSKAAGDLTRALNAVQTGFVDAATAASLKATRTIAAAETVERKAVAKADVVLAQDLQSAWGTYAAAERSAVTVNARKRADIGVAYKKEVAGAELAAVKAVAPARKTSMVATVEANGVYHVKVTGIVADLGILGGEIKIETTKAKATSISAWLGQKAQGLWDTAKDVVGTISKSYDAISLAAHTALGAGGMIPAYGIFPDAADLALTLVELPFGKSDGKDVALATVSLATTVAPGPVDVAAGGVKIGTRMAKAGARVADGVGGLRTSNRMYSIERATPELLDAIRSKGRSVNIVKDGSMEARYLDAIEAEANVGGETMTHILLRPNPGKAAALEEFLHGTQHRLGLIQRLGVSGAEHHIKDFMIRHQKLLGLCQADVEALRTAMEAGL